MQIALDTTTAKTNSDFQRQHFGIADMSIVMNLLSRLYSHPIRTLTQEYISNGRDANREVKASRPTEITMPTKFEPTLKIRDYGPGLSPERLRDVFLLYGASTKRATNEQTGGFGIGAKSAWAYTDSFTVITWHDGIKYTYVVHKSAGNGNMDLVEKVKSVEPTGTQIEIAVRQHDTQTFRSAVLRAVHFWHDAEKPALKGVTAGEIPGKAEELKINDNVSLVKNLHDFIGSNNDVVVIDGIPYPLPSSAHTGAYSDVHNKLNYAHMVIRINNADVNISPNREEIITDAKSEAFFKKIFDKAFKDINSHIEKELAKSKEVKDCLAASKVLMNWFRISNSYKGYRVSNNGIDVTVPAAPTLLPGQTQYTPAQLAERQPMFRYSTNYRKKISTRDTTHIGVEEVNRVYYVDINEFKSRTTMRIRNAVLTTNHSYILINKDCPDAPRLIKDLEALPVSSLELPVIQRAAKLPVEQREFCIHIVGNEGKGSPTQVNLSDLDKEHVYIPMSHDWYSNRVNLMALDQHCKDTIFCYIADSNLKYTKSKEGKAIFTHIDDFIKNFKAGDVEINATVKDDLEKLGKLSVYTPYKHLIVDTVLVKGIELYKNYKSDNYNSLPKVLADNSHNKPKIAAIKKSCAEVVELVKNQYPLLNFIDTYRLGKDVATELVEYMNAKYNKGSI